MAEEVRTTPYYIDDYLNDNGYYNAVNMRNSINEEIACSRDDGVDEFTAGKRL